MKVSRLLITAAAATCLTGLTMALPMAAQADSPNNIACQRCDELRARGGGGMFVPIEVIEIASQHCQQGGAIDSQIKVKANGKHGKFSTDTPCADRATGNVPLHEAECIASWVGYWRVRKDAPRECINAYNGEMQGQPAETVKKLKEQCKQEPRVEKENPAIDRIIEPVAKVIGIGWAF